MKLAGFLILLLALVGFPPEAKAHQVPTVEFEFQKFEGKWRLLGEMDIAYMLPETRKLPGSQPLSRAATMKAPPEELARIRRETEHTLRNLLHITFAGRDIPWKVEFPDFEKTPFALPFEEADWALISTRIVMDAQSDSGDLKIHWSGDEESELIVLTEDSEDGQIVSVEPGGTITLVKVADTGQVTAAEQSTFTGWIASGFRHVLPVGFDHMLFILGLFLLIPKWKPLMGQSLLFTLSHAVTLTLAVLGWLHLEGKVVEVLIAFSIAFVGVENLFSKKVGKLRYVLVFAFGLIHGVGVASLMAMKLRSIPRDQLAGPLIGFNLGVELAQVALFAAAFLLMWPLGKWQKQVQQAGSVFVGLAGFAWMIERLFFT